MRGPPRRGITVSAGAPHPEDPGKSYTRGLTRGRGLVYEGPMSLGGCGESHGCEPQGYITYVRVGALTRASSSNFPSLREHKSSTAVRAVGQRRCGLASVSAALPAPVSS